jgi:hypothetical protein
MQNLFLAVIFSRDYTLEACHATLSLKNESSHTTRVNSFFDSASPILAREKNSSCNAQNLRRIVRAIVRAGSAYQGSWQLAVGSWQLASFPVSRHEQSLRKRNLPPNFCCTR